MQRNFLQVKQFLEQNFPELEGNISGGNFPPPPHAFYLQNMLTFLHIVAVGFIFMGDTIWSFVPFVNSPPWWYVKCKENAMQTLIVIFLVIPSMVQSQFTTGAFEITLDGVTLFSRIESGQFPTAPQLIELFKNAGISQ